MSSIEIIACGGTIEKQYMPQDGSMGFGAATQLPAWLAQARLHPSLAVHISQAMLIDSLDANDQHRELLANTVRASASDRLLVVHGTDTMVASAMAVDAARRAGQVVVFVGAMVPMQIPGSDGHFNLGFGLAACQLAMPGTHIAMGGRLLPAGATFKNKPQGRFDTHNEP